jgi:glucose 1-dehydrogenase
MAGEDLKGQVALVTGASLGIGRATALALGRAGAHVAVNYRSHPDEAEQVVRAIRNAGSRAVPLRADVADQAAVERLAAETVEQLGKLTIAVGNAAHSDRHPFYAADLEGFRRTVDVTMWGAFYLLRAAAQQMIRQGQGGAIVLVSSPHAFLPVPGSMAYNISKAAVDQMAKTAALELAEFRIRVNIFQPGWTDTPGERKFATEEALREASRTIPLGRMGTPEEMAEGILFLCDPRHEYLTGATLLIDGGFSLPWWAGDDAPGPQQEPKRDEDETPPSV